MKKHKTYATFGLSQSYRQVVYALRNRERAESATRKLYNWVKSQETLIEKSLEKPVVNLRILELGPGQGMQRAVYFGQKNEVIGLDLDVIRASYSLGDYLWMARKNGVGRMMKTLGYQWIKKPPIEAAWKKILGTKQLKYPRVVYGDICKAPPEVGEIDLAVSWSVFEHLSDPRAAMKNLIDHLRPGGGIFTSIHLYTSISGHHDIRAFSGGLDTLPLWGHLRPALASQIVPSAYLNQWRLADWRCLFGEMTPGYSEILETADIPQVYGPKLAGALREELKAYTDEELLCLNALYIWKKPLHPA